MDPYFFLEIGIEFNFPSRRCCQMSTTDEAEEGLVSSPASLASSMPASLRSRLERRNNTTPKKSNLTVNSNSNAPPSPQAMEKENGVVGSPAVKAAPAVPSSPAAKSSAARRRSLSAASPSDAAAAPSPALRASPSRCVVEALKMEEARKLRRERQEKTKAERGEPDEGREFKAMIAAYRDAHPIAGPAATTEMGTAAAPPMPPRLRVCVRKRPLLAHEAGDFDVITCLGRTAVLHQTRRKVDLERVLENHPFTFDEVCARGRHGQIGRERARGGVASPARRQPVASPRCSPNAVGAVCVSPPARPSRPAALCPRSAAGA